MLLLATPLSAQTESQRVGVTEGYRMGAYFDGATTRYDHGVLGDDVEYGRLVAAVEHMEAVLDLPAGRVFEDIEPRIADVDGDGRPEIIVVETDMARGAQLAIYRARFVDGSGATLTKIAATAPIGRRHRWLAPAGIADFDGDGQADIAYVETPHLGKVLRIVTLRGGKLVQIAELPGVTNHRIGDAFISGGVRHCGGAPELILVDASWDQILSVTLTDGKPSIRVVGPFDDAAMANALRCS